ncbi:CocE/NonD family hydrolase [Amycolatopsis ultiminotia]|uniref:CocE/NonD family hydrolase n=1 Tax=Amycolatopsis ultiminotia TaxID=543629 RepID=A0ABP6VYC7_9PSEU
MTRSIRKSEIRDSMRIEWDVPIEMDDGVLLRADIFRPIGEGKVPAIASSGVYGKGLPFQGPPYEKLWEQMCEKYPDVPAGSTNAYQNWEVVDPEKWVPDGYAVIRIDTRGAGRSEGRMDPFTDREARDYYNCIQWVAEQDWSNGNVGLAGISYYAANQWQVAALAPPALKAICPWEGFNDIYRDAHRHGGILSTFLERWFLNQVTIVQHGLGSRGAVSPITGLQVSGDEDLSDDQLAARRGDISAEALEHEFDDQYHRDRSTDLATITVPILTAANWGGQGLHSRGAFRGFTHSSSAQKWLEVHGREHWTLFYTDYGRQLQKRFFDYFLKDGEGDWENQPPVLLQVRHPGEKFVERAEQEWPLARTEWRPLHLRPAEGRLSPEAPAEEQTRSYPALGDGLTLSTGPFEEQTELTGPLAARLWIASDTRDADIFLALRLFDPDGEEVLFHGANEPRAPISLGWLRASHRKLDAGQSEPWAPYHPHLEREMLEPGQVYPLDIEIWPTSIVIPAGYELRLTILGRDFDHGLAGGTYELGVEMRGSGFFLHDNPKDRPAELFDNTVTVLSGPEHDSFLLLPVIPEKQ